MISNATTTHVGLVFKVVSVVIVIVLGLVSVFVNVNVNVMRFAMEMT